MTNIQNSAIESRKVRKCAKENKELRGVWQKFGSFKNAICFGEFKLFLKMQLVLKYNIA